MGKPGTRDRRTLVAAIGAALAASACCVGPLVLVGLGFSGAWMSRLTILEPIRPLLILGTGGLLGYSYARVFSQSSQPKCDGDVCDNPRAGRVGKVALIGVALFVAALLMIPMVVEAIDTTKSADVIDPLELSADEDLHRVELSLQNMTCAGCSHTVREALAGVEGVAVLDVTSDPPRAVVEYDPAIVRVEALTTATANVGYPARVLGASPMPGM